MPSRPDGLSAFAGNHITVDDEGVDGQFRIAAVSIGAVGAGTRMKDEGAVAMFQPPLALPTDRAHGPFLSPTADKAGMPRPPTDAHLNPRGHVRGQVYR